MILNNPQWWWKGKTTWATASRLLYHFEARALKNEAGPLLCSPGLLIDIERCRFRSRKGATDLTIGPDREPPQEKTGPSSGCCELYPLHVAWKHCQHLLVGFVPMASKAHQICAGCLIFLLCFRSHRTSRRATALIGIERWWHCLRPGRKPPQEQSGPSCGSCAYGPLHVAWKRCQHLIVGLVEMFFKAHQICAGYLPPPVPAVLSVESSAPWRPLGPLWPLGALDFDRRCRFQWLGPSLEDLART